MEQIAQLLPPLGRRERIHALTGLRFIAAAMIVLHHSRGVLAIPRDFLKDVALHHGVSFFFVLSGFILTLVYPALPDGRSIRKFLTARFARLWPAHAFAFVLIIALGLHTKGQGAAVDPTALSGAANLAMIHAWVPTKAYFFSFNSVSWSISTEFFFYLAFILLIPRISQTWIWKALICVGLVCGMVAVCHVGEVRGFNAAGPYEVNRAGLLYIGPIARLAEFFLGMMTARLWGARVWTTRVNVRLGTVLEFGAVCLCVAAVVFFSKRAMLAATVGESWASYLQHVGAAPAFAILILAFAGQQGLLSRFCGCSGMILLGEISFSIYLLHQILLRWLVTHPEKWAGWGETATFSVFCAGLLVLSWAVWRFIEIPARRQLLRLAPAT